MHLRGSKRESQRCLHSQSTLSLTDCAYMRTWLASAGPIGQFSRDTTQASTRLLPTFWLTANGGMQATFADGRRDQNGKAMTISVPRRTSLTTEQLQGSASPARLMH